jgi:hypothetical protein
MLEGDMLKKTHTQHGAFILQSYRKNCSPHLSLSPCLLLFFTVTQLL